MKLQDWIDSVLDQGLVCDRYSYDVRNAFSKANLLDVGLDANGFAFIMEMDKKGYPLPYETILLDLKSYINGRYIVRKAGKSYTTSVYCCYSESIVASTTLTLFFGCTMDVYIKENDFVALYCDGNTKLRIHCPKTSKCDVEAWGNAEIVNINNTNIDIKYHKDGDTR